MTSPLFFEPIYKERVWGGRGLDVALGRKLPVDKKIGESWEVVDRPEAQSVVSRGNERGETLRRLIEARTEELMGPGFAPERPFPILVKWLDCQDRLSLQVHPPAKIAPELGGEPKTENWYIAEASEEAHLIVGLKPGVTRERFERAIREETVEACVHRFPVRAGHSIFVRSGQIHAIDAGNLILEIQQNSDTTYRVYDWGRVGLDGRARELHVEPSLASIDFEDIEPEAVEPVEGDLLLAECAEFVIRKFQMTAEREISFNANEQPRLLHVVSGKMRIEAGGESWEAVRGENALLPYAGTFRIATTEPGVLLMTSDFV